LHVIQLVASFLEFCAPKAWSFLSVAFSWQRLSTGLMRICKFYIRPSKLFGDSEIVYPTRTIPARPAQNSHPPRRILQTYFTDCRSILRKTMTAAQRKYLPPISLYRVASTLADQAHPNSSRHTKNPHFPFIRLRLCLGTAPLFLVSL
jgi:hypothetical protein